MQPPFDLLVAGEINPDLIVTGDVIPAFGQAEKLVDSAALTVGSSSAIFACAAARLGMKVAFTGVCGQDHFGRFMLDQMAERGVDITNILVDPQQQTGLSVILSREPAKDRAILTFPGSIPALRSDQVSDDLFRKSRHLHVASYFLQTALQPGLPELFARAHAFGLTTSLDTNWDPSGKWSGVQELLPKTDIFLPNEKEALALTCASSVQEALRLLGLLAGTVALKVGDKGALACQRGRMASAHALSVQVVDTVGAGDTFDAGFICGFLHGWNLEKALNLAAVCGSLSTRAAGGTDAQPTLEEALQYVPSIG